MLPWAQPGLLPWEFPLPAELLPHGLCSNRVHLAREPHPSLESCSAGGLCSSMNPKERLTGWEVMPGVPCAGVSLSPAHTGCSCLLFSNFHPQCSAVFGISSPAGSSSVAHPWNAVPSSSSLWNWKAPHPPGSGLVLTTPSFHTGLMMLYRWEVTFF